MRDPSTVCLEHLQACGLVKWVAVWFGWLLNWGRRWLMREHALITDQCLTRHCDHMWAHTHTFNFWGQACSFSSQSPSLWGKNHHPCGEVFWNFPPPARSRLPGVKMLWSSWDIVCLQIQFSQSFIRLSQAVVGWVQGIHKQCSCRYKYKYKYEDKCKYEHNYKASDPI